MASYRCTCPSAYVGRTCATPYCLANNPCRNGGTCHGAGLCRCPPGFIGADCSIDLCQMVTCHNGGSCVNGSCVCPPGIAGSTCDVDICDQTVCLVHETSCISVITCRSASSQHLILLYKIHKSLILICNQYGINFLFDSVSLILSLISLLHTLCVPPKSVHLPSSPLSLSPSITPTTVLPFLILCSHGCCRMVAFVVVESACVLQDLQVNKCDGIKTFLGVSLIFSLIDRGTKTT